MNLGRRHTGNPFLTGDPVSQAILQTSQTRFKVAGLVNIYPCQVTL